MARFINLLKFPTSFREVTMKRKKLSVGVRLLGCILAMLVLAFSTQGGAKAAAPFDFDVTHISQNPKYFHYRLYEVFDNEGSGIPFEISGTENSKHWPTPGEPMTFTAHVLNKGTGNSPAFTYRWYVNGSQVKEGTYASSLPPGGEGKIDLVYLWPTLDQSNHTSQTIGFEVLTQDPYLQNNKLTDYLGAMSLSIWADTGQWQTLNARENGVGTFSFEDWVQWQVRTLNERFAKAVYNPVAPKGVLERIRIDKIVVAEHVQNNMANDPDQPYIDGRWQFTGNSAQDYENYANNFAKQIDGGLLHEIAHQLGVIDLYRIGLSPVDNFVLDDAGKPSNIGMTPFNYSGMMGGGSTSPYNDGSYLSSHDAGALNENLGYRRGYYGEYLYDIPRQNYIRVLDSQGNPVPNAQVTVYQKATPLSKGIMAPLLKGGRVVKVSDASFFNPGMEVVVANSLHNGGNNEDFITTIASIDATKNPQEIVLSDAARYDYDTWGLSIIRLEVMPGKPISSGTTDGNGLYLLPNRPSFKPSPPLPDIH